MKYVSMYLKNNVFVMFVLVNLSMTVDVSRNFLNITTEEYQIHEAGLQV